MSWWLAGAFVISALGGMGLVWLAGIRHGRIKRDAEQTEKELEHAKKVNEIQAQPDINWSDWVSKLRSKNKL